MVSAEKTLARAASGLRYGYGIDTPLLLLALYVCIGEILGCYVLGELFASVLLKRREIFRENGPQ